MLHLTLVIIIIIYMKIFFQQSFCLVKVIIQSEQQGCVHKHSGHGDRDAHETLAGQAS